MGNPQLLVMGMRNRFGFVARRSRAPPVPCPPERFTRFTVWDRSSMMVLE
jgi:hypothetical protein